jgi:hypothetical protein
MAIGFADRHLAPMQLDLFLNGLGLLISEPVAVAWGSSASGG